MYVDSVPSSSAIATGFTTVGVPSFMCFWKKPLVPRPSGCRTRVSGRFATYGNIASETTARYAMSAALVVPVSG
jgi:hypothetical protein